MAGRSVALGCRSFGFPEDRLLGPYPGRLGEEGRGRWLPVRWRSQRCGREAQGSGAGEPGAAAGTVEQLDVWCQGRTK
jgi:hypothetical protein